MWHWGLKRRAKLGKQRKTHSLNKVLLLNTLFSLERKFVQIHTHSVYASLFHKQLLKRFAEKHILELTVTLNS